LQYPDFLFPGQTQFSSEPQPTGIDIEVALNSVNPFNWVSLGQKLAREKPDLVVLRYWLPFMGPALGTVARLIRANGHTRIVAITDNVVPHEKRPGDTLFTRYFLGACHGFVTMSRAVLADLKQFAPVKPARYQPHPLYDSFGAVQERAEALATLGLDPQHQYALFFGFIRAYKGLDLLLEAWGDPRLAALPVKLVIAGEYYEDAAPYEAIIQEFKLEKRLVRRTEFIADSAVAAYFSVADLVVQPYKNATQSGVSQVAYHFDRPMLVTDVGGLAELVPHGVVGYVTPPTPTAIADALVDFFTHPERSATFKAGVQRVKLQFSWSEMVAALAEVGQV
jgi:D-inositol-3-phosphate glycosyltransferase